jgi:hypothetical protein
MRIIVKSKLEIPLGRFRLLIDEMQKLVSIRWVAGDAPDQAELKSIDKFLRYKRPDILSEHAMTGWAMECISAPIATSFRAKPEMSR